MVDGRIFLFDSAYGGARNPDKIDADDGVAVAMLGAGTYDLSYVTKGNCDFVRFARQGAATAAPTASRKSAAKPAPSRSARLARTMKLLLTSNGITNQSIHRALVELLGKPIADARALFVPTGMYPFAGGAGYAWQAIAGKSHHPFCELGWKSFGNLELSVLPSIDKQVWAPEVAAADALLVWGGDPLFLAHWMHASGLADVVAEHTVYVGTSAGSMVASTTIGETYTEARRASGEPLSSEAIVLPDGEIARTFVTARGMGWVDFAVIPHYGAERHGDASAANAKVWASKLPLRTYAIDDDTAIVVKDGHVEVITEGRWELFTP